MFIENIMEKCRVELTARGKKLAEVKILRGAFKQDVLSPLSFVKIDQKTRKIMTIHKVLHARNVIGSLYVQVLMIALIHR